MELEKLLKAIKIMQEGGIRSLDQAELFIQVAMSPKKRMRDIANAKAGSPAYTLLHNRLRSLEAGRQRSKEDGPYLIEFNQVNRRHTTIAPSKKGKKCIQKIKRA